MESLKSNPIKINYDEKNDIIEIEGIKYACEIFRKFGGIQKTPENKCLKIIQSNNGVLVLKESNHITVENELL